MTLTETMKHVEALPPHDRYSLLTEALERLYESGYVPELDDETKAILDERMEDAERYPGNTVTWEEIVARVKGPRP